MTVCFKGRIKFGFFFLLAFYSVFFVSSCRKNENTVGADFVSEIIGFDVEQSDTSTLIAYTVIQDSFPTKNLSYYMLGGMNDPEFGTSTSSVISQVATPVEGYSFPAGILLDSIILQFNYTSSTSFYGNANTPQTIKVYELEETLSRDSAYYSNRNYNYKSEVLGEWTNTFSTAELGNPKTIIYGTDTTTILPHLRIKLDNQAFLTKILNAPLATNVAFQEYFKGFILVPTTSPLIPGDGGMVYLNMSNSITSMVLYYRTNSGTTKEKIAFPMFQSRSIKTNQFKHQHTAIIPIQPSIGGVHKDVNYVQPMSGLKTRILIPHIFDFVQKRNIAITGAEIIFTPEPSSFGSPYLLPTYIQLNDADSLGKSKTIRDILLGDSYYGGTFNNGQFRFNIVRHIQYLLKQYKNNNLNYNYGLNLIVPADNPIAANRLKLNTNLQTGNLKLKLTYSVIKE